MKYIPFLIIIIPTICFGAVAPDIRISDPSGNVAVINSDGSINSSLSVNDSTRNTSTSPDMRISDDNGNVASITSDGKLTLKL